VAEVGFRAALTVVRVQETLYKRTEKREHSENREIEYRGPSHCSHCMLVVTGTNPVCPYIYSSSG